jgi:hypothetical protein
MIEILVAALTAVLAFLVWERRGASNIFQATSDDWFIHIASNADAKTVHLTFYPVVAFKIQSGYCEPISSRPQVTGPLWRAGHAANAALVTSVTEEYGRWFRHGFRYDNFGSLCWSGLHLLHMIRIYRGAGYRVGALNPPPSYVQYFEPEAAA